MSDEYLDNRLLFALGISALKKMEKASIFISGMNGLGIEIAKNIVLSGINFVMIHDTHLTTLSDLASQFYLKQSMVGQNRARASLPSLQVLNEKVTVEASTSPLSVDLIKNFNYIIVAESLPESLLLTISNYCHENQKKLVIAESRGLFAYTFNDFGNNFIVHDPSSQWPSKFHIEDITHDERGIVYTGREYH